MLNSVRLRLTLWYAGVLTMVLVLFAAGVYTVVERQAYSRLDAELGSVLHVMSLSLAHEIEEHKGQAEGEHAFADLMPTMHQSSFPKQGVAVFQQSRQVAVKRSYDGLLPPPAADEPERPLFRTSGALRVAGVRVPVPGVAVPYRITVAQRMESTAAELASLQRALFIVVPLGVVLAAIPGYLLARKSLAPVVAMSKDADRISSSNLAARIEVANPRDELGRLGHTLNSLLERLQAAFDRQKQFMADASHELRTPISIARTAAQVTLDGPPRDSGEYRDALAMIEKQMSRLTRLVNDLFLLSKADSGAALIHHRRFFLDATVREAVNGARVLASAKDLEISCNELAESPFEGDEDLVRQLLLLLLDNAVKYTPDGGSVRLELSRQGRRYQVSVSDTGPGIPADAQAHIFERFYRVDKARSRSASTITAGAGLGLSIGKWIAEAHGGSIHLERSGPGGSTFVVRLPSSQEIADRVAESAIAG